jgi:hypothetical protein
MMLFLSDDGLEGLRIENAALRADNERIREALNAERKTVASDESEIERLGKIIARHERWIELTTRERDEARAALAKAEGE